MHITFPSCCGVVKYQGLPRLILPLQNLNTRLVHSAFPGERQGRNKFPFISFAVAMKFPFCCVSTSQVEAQQVRPPSPSRKLLPRFFWARLMLYICFIQTITVIGLIIYIVNNDQTDIVYRLVFLVGKIFALIICWDAVTHKNTIQAISFVVFTFFCLFYAVLQLKSKETYGATASITPLFIPAIIVVEACCTISYIVLTWEIYREYGWKIFKKLGANETIHRMYLHHQVLIVLLQLELFFSISVAVQLATLLSTQTPTEKGLQIGLGIPLSVLVLTLGFYALVQENRFTMIFVILCHWGTLGYFSYRLAKIFPSPG
ncbi:hypothetical protein DSO57_1024257 [Entomophthora muscae]|uniref:Uncharacterized protein n=1 Tax=Entomophthora muscae TaxID=34485 RepID=A0ACC2RHA2_9FUNG|nr:hypothetical protein DSO57_1024257 [Entomophthora muscae]